MYALGALAGAALALAGCGGSDNSPTTSERGDIKIVEGAEGCYQLGQWVRDTAATPDQVQEYKLAMLDICDSWDQHKAALEAETRDGFQILVDSGFSKDVGDLQAICNSAGDTGRSRDLCLDIPIGDDEYGEYLGTN